MGRCLEGSIHFLTFGFRRVQTSFDVPLALALQYPYVKYKVFVLVHTPYILVQLCTEYLYIHNLPRLLHVSDQLYQLHQLHLLQVVGVTTHRKKDFSFKMFSVSVCIYIT